MQLLATLIGAPVRSINPEVDAAVSNLSGTIAVREQSYAVVRPLVTTDTAPVQVANATLGLTLPASRAATPGGPTFGRWMLSQLGLPDLRVPAAPSRPEESETTPVSIADYLAYCRLRQDEVDVDVLGSSKPFRDIKRRYVFRILYGTYDSSVAALQQELRNAENELRGLEQAESSFSHFLEGTPLENRAALERELTDVRSSIESLRLAEQRVAKDGRASPAAVELLERIDTLDRELARLAGEAVAEEESAGQLKDLIVELETQSARLTRAVVAGALLHDFDFVVCPRCGQDVDAHRAADPTCYLCLQEVSEEARREDLLKEQDRIRSQIVETEELVGSHLSRTG
jgi:hypothetical protein